MTSNLKIAIFKNKMEKGFFFYLVRLKLIHMERNRSVLVDNDNLILLKVSISSAYPQVTINLEMDFQNLITQFLSLAKILMHALKHKAISVHGA